MEAFVNLLGIISIVQSSSPLQGAAIIDTEVAAKGEEDIQELCRYLQSTTPTLVV